MKYKYRLMDSEPLVGIFEIIDNNVYFDVDFVENCKSVNGIVDAGNKFHIDIMRHQVDTDELSPESSAFINKHKTDPDLHRYFPRGRMCYNYNTNKFEIYSNEEVLRNTNWMNKILKGFNVKPSQLDAFVDEQHYKLLNKEEDLK